jgi:hypothetical protein
MYKKMAAFKKEQKMKILTERVGEKPQIRRSKDTNLL